MNLEISQSSSLFEKRIVSELSEMEMVGVDGGATPLTLTTPIPVVAAGIAVFYAGYQFGQWLHDATH